MVKTPRFQCWGARVRSLVGELRSHVLRAAQCSQKKKKNQKIVMRQNSEWAVENASEGYVRF